MLLLLLLLLFVLAVHRELQMRCLNKLNRQIQLTDVSAAPVVACAVSLSEFGPIFTWQMGPDQVNDIVDYTTISTLMAQDSKVIRV